MKKAIYVTPVIEIHRIDSPVIMAGSGGQNNMSIDVEDDPNDLFEETFRSKQTKKSLWD